MPHPKAASRPTVKLRVCRGATCGPDGGNFLVADLEDLCDGRAQVESWSCFDECGRGPNVEVVNNGDRGNIEGGIRTLEDAQKLIRRHVNDVATPTEAQERVTAIKWQARREEDAGKRAFLLQEGFALMDPAKLSGRDVKSYAQLLLMRCQERLRVARVNEKEPLALALADAVQAKELRPGWAPVHEAFATVLEKSGRHDEAVVAIKEALAIGTGIDVGAVKRQLRRVERKVELKARGAEPPNPARYAPPDMAAVQPPPPALLATPSPAKALSKTAEAPPRHRSGLEDFTLRSTVRVNHNCVLLDLRAKFPATENQDRRNDVPIDIFHVNVCADVAGEGKVSRPYTPLSSYDCYRQGQLDLMVKVYPDGKMSQHLGSLVVGDTLQVSPPKPTLDDLFPVQDGLVVIAGGSAVTVAIQVCAAALRTNPRGMPVNLVLCNRTVEDVLFVDRLGPMQRLCSSFHVTHVIEVGELPKQPSPFAWHSGRLTAKVLQDVAPHTQAVLSGPPGLLQASQDLLLRLGWRVEDIRYLDTLRASNNLEIQETPTFDELSSTGSSSVVSTLSSLGSLWGQFRSLMPCRRRRRSNGPEAV